MAEFTPWSINSEYKPHPVDRTGMSANRPPDWMWQRAVGTILGTEPGPTRRFDSAEGVAGIKKLIKFIHKKTAAASLLDEYNLAFSMPEIFWAHRMYENKSDILRYSIEAHALAGSSDLDIAMRVNYSANIIKTFCDMFFDVRSRLDKQQWIVHSVIGISVHHGIAERQFDLLWKLYGLMMGSQMLDALELKFINPVRPMSADMVGNAIEDDVVSTMKLKANLAAKGVTAGNATYGMLLDRFTRFVEIERNSDTQGQAHSSILKNVEEVLNNMPFRVGQSDTRIKGRVKVTAAQAQMTEFESTPVELTYAETVQVAGGQLLQDPDRLREMRFPDRTKDKPKE
jgi:hypothetical protein